MKFLFSLLVLVVAMVTASALPWGGGGYQAAGSYGGPVRVVAGGYGGDNSREFDGYGGRDDGGYDNSAERGGYKQW